MKRYFAMAVCVAAIAGCLVMGAAKAETINSTAPVDCGTLRQCAVVPNDAGESVTALDAAAQYGRVLVTINGVTYDSGLYVVLPMGDSFANVLLYGSDGSSARISASYTSYRTCNHTGRGQSCVTHWTLATTTIVR